MHLTGCSSSFGEIQLNAQILIPILTLPLVWKHFEAEIVDFVFSFL